MTSEVWLVDADDPAAEPRRRRRRASRASSTTSSTTPTRARRPALRAHATPTAPRTSSSWSTPVASPGRAQLDRGRSPTGPTSASTTSTRSPATSCVSERADGPRAAARARPRRRRRRAPRDRDARRRVLGVGRREPRVRHDDAALRLHVAGHAGVGVRLRPRRRASATLVKRQPVAGLRPRRSTRRDRLWATAADGTRVPISIVHRARPARATAPRPLLLYGYGSYEVSIDPTFSSPRVSLLDRGVVFAIAHVRGGGELGARWYEDGKLDAQAQHVHRLHRLRRAPRRRGLDRARAARGARRQRRRAADGRGREPAPRPVPRRSSPRCRSSTASPRCSTRRCPLTDHRVGGVGRPGRTTRRSTSYMKSYSPYDNVERAGLPGAARDRRAQRPAGAVLGAGQVGGQAARDEDRRPTCSS